MKTTIRIIAAAAMLAAVSTPALAQGGRGGASMQERQAQRRTLMFEGITLTDVQKAKIDTIDALSQKAMTDARAAAGEDRQAMQGKMRELQTKQMDEIKKVLTPEQLTKFEENVAKLSQGRGGRGGAR